MTSILTSQYFGSGRDHSFLEAETTAASRHFENNRRLAFSEGADPSSFARNSIKEKNKINNSSATCAAAVSANKKESGSNHSSLLMQIFYSAASIIAPPPTAAVEYKMQNRKGGSVCELGAAVKPELSSILWVAAVTGNDNQATAAQQHFNSNDPFNEKNAILFKDYLDNRTKQDAFEAAWKQEYIKAADAVAAAAADSADQLYPDYLARLNFSPKHATRIHNASAAQSEWIAMAKNRITNTVHDCLYMAKCIWLGRPIFDLKSRHHLYALGVDFFVKNILQKDHVCVAERIVFSALPLPQENLSCKSSDGCFYDNISAAVANPTMLFDSYQKEYIWYVTLKNGECIPLDFDMIAARWGVEYIRRVVIKKDSPPTPHASISDDITELQNNNSSSQNKRGLALKSKSGNAAYKTNWKEAAAQSAEAENSQQQPLPLTGKEYNNNADFAVKEAAAASFLKLDLSKKSIDGSIVNKTIITLPQYAKIVTICKNKPVQPEGAAESEINNSNKRRQAEMSPPANNKQQSPLKRARMSKPPPSSEQAAADKMDIDTISVGGDAKSENDAAGKTLALEKKEDIIDANNSLFSHSVEIAEKKSKKSSGAASGAAATQGKKQQNLRAIKEPHVPASYANLSGSDNVENTAADVILEKKLINKSSSISQSSGGAAGSSTDDFSRIATDPLYDSRARSAVLKMLKSTYTKKKAALKTQEPMNVQTIFCDQKFAKMTSEEQLEHFKNILRYFFHYLQYDPLVLTMLEDPPHGNDMAKMKKDPACADAIRLVVGSIYANNYNACIKTDI